MELPERWWFAPHANDAEAKRFQRPESKKDMQARCPCLPRPAAFKPDESSTRCDWSQSDEETCKRRS